MNFVLMSGSFRKQSHSLKLLNIIDKLLGQHNCNTPRLDKLPFYSEDIESNKPQILDKFLYEISIADGLIICSPEYNHSIPAVLKNALDWASRPAFASPMKHMPTTIITQADSLVGGARAQSHIKLVLDAMLAYNHPNHEMMITNVSKLLSDDKLDAQVLARLERHLEQFVKFVETLKQR